MALINKNNHYIKLYADGTYEVYASAESREQLKNSTPSEVILQKYQELLDDLNSQEERKYYDPSFADEYGPLLNEYERYQWNLQTYNTIDDNYPIMTQYYPDVAHSIPHIIETGRVYDHADTSAENYINTKKRHRWGDTTDA